MTILIGTYQNGPWNDRRLLCLPGWTWLEWESSCVLRWRWLHSCSTPRCAFVDKLSDFFAPKVTNSWQFSSWSSL